jgi:hypothetical protein
MKTSLNYVNFLENSTLYRSINCYENSVISGPHTLWAGLVTRMGKVANAHADTVRTPEGYGLLGRCMRKLQGKIELDLKLKAPEDVD